MEKKKDGRSKGGRGNKRGWFKYRRWKQSCVTKFLKGCNMIIWVSRLIISNKNENKIYP